MREGCASADRAAAFGVQGSTQITSVDNLGRNYEATVHKGDLWYFPPGIPHSLQATNDSSEGTEFLLVSLSYATIMNP